MSEKSVQFKSHGLILSWYVYTIYRYQDQLLDKTRLKFRQSITLCDIATVKGWVQTFLPLPSMTSLKPVNDEIFSICPVLLMSHSLKWCEQIVGCLAGLQSSLAVHCTGPLCFSYWFCWKTMLRKVLQRKQDVLTARTSPDQWTSGMLIVVKECQTFSWSETFL